MHYRTITIGISLAALFIVLLAGLSSKTWIANLSQLAVLALIIVLTIGILRSTGFEQDPPPRNKWYHF
jgi:hypothetical protein